MSALAKAAWLEKEIARAALSVIERAFGPGAAAATLARGPFRRTPARLNFLMEMVARRRGPAAARRLALRLLCGRPQSGWHALLLGSRDWAPEAAAVLAATPALIAAARRTGDGALLVSALLEAGHAEAAARAFEAARRDTAAGAGFKAFAAACLRPLDAPEPEGFADIALADLAPRPARRRLVVVEKSIPTAAIAALAADAEQATVLVFGDLYGALDLDALAAQAGGARIAVEHARSRADRFSPRYHALHVATAAAAETIVAALDEVINRFAPERADPAALRPGLVLEIADRFFFAALRANAVLAAMRDPAFDDVVLCFDRDWRLYRIATADPVLAADPRVRACCRSAVLRVRRGHFDRLAAARGVMTGEPAAEPALGAGRRDELEARVDAYLSTVAAGLARRGGQYHEGGPRVALATGQDRAYVRDALGLANALRVRFDVDLLWTRGDPAIPRDGLAAMAAEGPRPGVVALAPRKAPQSAAAAFAALARAAAPPDRPGLSGAADAAVRVGVRNEMNGPLAEALLATFARLHIGAAALRRYRYGALLVCPARTPMNLQLVALARAARVPTAIIEPHCLNAAYCRYASVPADMALVATGYFADEYARHFGVPRERCRAIGSPRIQPPPDYDPVTARAAARTALGFGAGDPPIVLMPTQPMADGHAMAVWRMAVEAMAALGRPALLLLKPHPEEGDERVARYLAIADEAGAGARCRVAGGDVKDLIAASDMVLVLYSVTALEAAALDRPVAIVGRPGVAYPVPYHAILGAPLCLSAAETAAAIRDALAGGAATKARMAAFRAANPQLFDNGYGDRLADAVADLVAQGPAAIRPADGLPRDPFVTAPFHPYFTEAA